MIFVGTSTLYNRDHTKNHMMYVYSQPGWRKLLAEAYHFYDMHFWRSTGRPDGSKTKFGIFKISGPVDYWVGTHICKPLKLRKGARDRLDPAYHNTDPFDYHMPWSAKQDLRCYALREKYRKVIYSTEISEEEFNRLRPKSNGDT